MREGWSYKKLGDLCDIISGRNQKDVEAEDGAYPIYGSGGIMGHATAFLCEACTTIVGRKGTINKPLYVSERFWNVDTAFGLQPKDITDSKFLFYLCKSIDFTKYDKSVTIPSLVKKDLLKIDVCCPPLTTQQQIVSELDLLSHILDQKRQQLKEYDALAESIFYDMFGDPVENPKGWEAKKLKEMCSKITDGTHRSPQNFPEGQYKYITAKNIKKDGFCFNELTFVSKEDHEEIFSRCKPEYGDVLYIKDGITTGIAMVNTLEEEFSLLSSVALLKLEPIINNKYLCAVLNHPTKYKEIRSDMGGAAITRLTLKKIEMIKIPLPPLSLQRSFAAKIESIEHQKQLLRASIKETEMLFQSRMDYWFNE